jgi:glycosyltransferase involved in cell wall biosynthesis
MGPTVATERMLKSEVMRRAFRMELLDIGDPKGQEDMGRLNWWNISLALRHAFQSFRLAVGFRPQVVYISIARGLWGFVRDIALLAPLRLTGAKILVHLRAGRFDMRHDDGWLGRTVARLGLAGVSRGIVLGETVRDVYGPYVRADKVRIVPNGMNLEGWDADRWMRERERNEGFHIACVTNLKHDKGAHVVLPALLKVREVIPDVKVSFAGEWFDRDYRKFCTEFVEKHDLHRNTEFLGGLDDIEKRKLYAMADISVFVPVKPEGQPWVVLEAMASALPVIGTPQGTMKEMIVEGENGYMIPIEDPDALADRIIMLARDRELRVRLGCNGRKRVEQVYAETVTHQKLVDTAMEALYGTAKLRDGN